MNTEVVKSPQSDLVIHSSQGFWSPKQRAALEQLGVKGASNADLAVFFHQCVRTGLDPFARQVYMLGRKDRVTGLVKQTIQMGIDGFRLIARRASDARKETFGYEETLWCGQDGKWVDVWLSTTPPAASKVTVVRCGGRFPAIALYDEYVGRKYGGEPNSMWATKPSLMLAKCAEALALRKAFPQDLSGLYTTDEMNSTEPTWETPQIAPISPVHLNGTIVDKVAPGTDFDELMDYIENVQSQDDYDTVKAGIDKSGLNMAIKKQLHAKLDKRAEELVQEPLPI